MVQKIDGKAIKEYTNLINVDSDLVIIENFPIYKFNEIKIKGNCKVIFIINSFLRGEAKKEIKKMRKNCPDNSDDEYDFYEEHYCFDLTEIDNLEIVVDACDRMANEYYPKVVSHKYNINTIIEIDEDGNRICDFAKELKAGEIKTTLNESEINYIYDNYSQ